MPLGGVSWCEVNTSPEDLLSQDRQVSVTLDSDVVLMIWLIGLIFDGTEKNATQLILSN